MVSILRHTDNDDDSDGQWYVARVTDPDSQTARVIKPNEEVEVDLIMNTPTLLFAEPEERGSQISEEELRIGKLMLVQSNTHNGWVMGRIHSMARNGTVTMSIRKDTFEEVGKDQRHRLSMCDPTRMKYLHD